MKNIPIDERATNVKNPDLNCDTLPIDRALGVQWSVDIDAFCFKISLKSRPITRRGIVSMISSVHNPFGFIGPLTLIGKMILQEFCIMKLG